jgi:hypothetical protein
MKYAVEMGSGAMIYIQSFIKSGLDIQKLIRRKHIYRDTDSKALSSAHFNFFNIRKVWPLYINIMLH